MVERSKKPASRKVASSSRSRRGTFEREQAVLFESMRSDFRVFGEALQGFREEVGARFEQIDARFDGIDTRLDRLDQDVVLLKDAVVANTREIKTIQVALEKKVDRDEVEAIVERVVGRG